MSLITCPKCGKSTSDLVRWCAHCGCDFAAWEKRGRKKGSSALGEKATFLDWIKIIGVIAALYVAISLFGVNLFATLSHWAANVFNMVRDVLRIIVNL